MDTDSLAAGFELTTEGIVLGSFYGLITEGISVQVKTENVNGDVRLYLKNGNEVWHGVELTSTSPKQTIQGDYKVFSF